MAKMTMKELSKKDTKMMQGISVLAMLCLHLFCTYEYEGKYIPLIYCGGIPLVFFFAQLSDFCVFGFAFCSGYGHMAQYTTAQFYKKRLKGLLSVLLSYWIVLIVFCGISIILGHSDFMPGSLHKFVMNAFTLGGGYNGAWWYMFAYVVLVLCSPFLLKLIDRFNSYAVFGVGFAIYCAAYYIRFHYVSDMWIVGKAGPLGMTLFEYFLGAVFFKEHFFSKANRLWESMPKVLADLLGIITLIILLYGHTKIVGSLFVAPINGVIVFFLFHVWRKPAFFEKFLLFIGQHSTNIWLTHMFFYLVLFEGLVYRAKYPILIYIYMLSITVLVSIILQFVQKPLQKMIAKL